MSTLIVAKAFTRNNEEFVLNSFKFRFKRGIRYTYPNNFYLQVTRNTWQQYTAHET